MNISSNTKEFLKKGVQVFNHYKATLDPSDKIVILLYHRILEEPYENPLGTIVSKENFENQIRYLSENFKVTSLDRAFVDSSNGLKVIITFDDGYIDNYKIAFPILKKYGLTAHFFLATNYISSGQPIWDWDLKLMLDNSNKNFDINIGLENFDRNNYQGKDNALLWELISRLKFFRSDERSKIIDNIKKQLEVYELDYSEDRCMNWEEIKLMKEEGMYFGSHGSSHTSFSSLDKEALDQEIKTSLDILNKELSLKRHFLAFPFGSKADFNDEIIKRVLSSGYERCLLNVQGYNIQENNEFSLKRKVISNDTNLKYILG